MKRGDAPSSEGRRRVLRLLGAAASSFVLLSTRSALAGSYLDRIGLLVRQARGEIDYLEWRLGDKELAELIHKLATARLAAARDMLIPKEVVQAHPHLLLMLEDCERAADAAEAGERTRFVTFQRKARDEEQMFRSIMRQLGFPLEDEKKK
jgi:hypothetical protein